jgi:Entner-Doudoroff aldolase
MQSDQILKTIERGRIIAILRGDFQSREVEIVSALLQSGITAVEVTLNSADPFAAISRLAEKFANRMAVGAGTVLRPDQVARAADSGATFIVSPNRNPAVISATKQRGLVSIPGCFTPSEIIEAFDAGADAAKLFPAVALGTAFVKAIRGPLGNVRLVPTGGIDPDLARQYIASGAWAIGVGSELVGPDALAPGGIDRVALRAKLFVTASLT